MKSKAHNFLVHLIFSIKELEFMILNLKMYLNIHIKEINYRIIAVSGEEKFVSDIFNQIFQISQFFPIDFKKYSIFLIQTK